MNAQQICFICCTKPQTRPFLPCLPVNDSMHKELRDRSSGRNWLFAFVRIGGY
jgi:hypothetical protein